MSIQDKDFAQLCQHAITINLTFADLKPLLHRTRLLALNAEIAAAHLEEQGESFGVVAKEIIAMGAQLQDLITQIEGSFRQVTLTIARWLRANKKLYLNYKSAWYLTTKVDDKYQPFESINHGFLMSPALVQKWRHCQHSEDKTKCLLFGMLLDNRDLVAKHIDTISTLSHQLQARINNLNLIAARKSNYLAVTARLEAGKLSGTSLNSVAENIRTVANDFSTLEKNAAARVDRLISLVTNIANQI